MNESIKDLKQRPLKALRVSLTDRCNLRCRYCMPPEKFPADYPFLKNDELMSHEESFRLVSIFCELGVRKLRLTGGEPLLRAGVVDAVASYAALIQEKKLQDLAMTTNGILLPAFADKLKKAGLTRLTVSLDGVDSKVLFDLNRGRSLFDKVIKGLKNAQEAGFSNLKVNMVVIKGVNDHQVLPMIDFFKQTPYELRFIEYMDVGNSNGWNMEQVVSANEIVALIDKHDPVEPLPRLSPADVARRYAFKDGRGSFGIVSSVSQPFCSACDRGRLTASGVFYTCLFASKGTDLLTPLRQGATDHDIRVLIEKTWEKREDHYSELRHKLSQSSSSRKIEMHHMGG